MSTKGLNSYQIRKVKDNLKWFFEQADADQVERGTYWYLKASIWCEKMAVQYRYNSETVAEVLSALSPRNKWERNKFDAEQVLKAVNEGTPSSDIKVCTFNGNKEKAFDIARGKTRIVHGSPKTYAFVQNIAYLNDDFVTVDVWHLRACFNRFRNVPNLTETRYRQLEKATIQVAKEYGLRGFEFQAIVWETIRDSY